MSENQEQNEELLRHFLFGTSPAIDMWYEHQEPTIMMISRAIWNSNLDRFALPTTKSLEDQPLQISPWGCGMAQWSAVLTIRHCLRKHNPRVAGPVATRTVSA